MAQQFFSLGAWLVLVVACSSKTSHTTNVVDSGSGASGGWGGGAASGGTGGSAASGGTDGSGAAGGSAAQGGTNAADGSGGSSGIDGGADGSAGSTGAGNDAGRRRVLLVPNAQLEVELSTNDVGIQGYWYGFVHNVGPDQQPSTVKLTAMQDGVCIDAHVHRVEDVDGNQVIDGVDFAAYWGVGVALQLNNPGPGENVYNATAQGVEGFSFLLDGSALPPELRVNYTTPLEFCKIFDHPAAGAYLALFSEARQNCWLAAPTPGAPDAKALYRLQINVQAFATWPTKFMDFNFCIRNLRAQLS